MGSKLAISTLFVSLTVIYSAIVVAAPTLEDYGALPAVDNMAISPDGKLVAFRKSSGKDEVIAVVSIEDKKFIQGLNVSDIRVRGLYFFDKSKLISVASENRHLFGYRDSFDVSTAFLLNLESGKLEQLLTPGDVIYKGQSGLGRVVGISQDGKYAYMPAYVPKSKQDQSPDYSLVQVDLDSPRRPRVVERGEDFTLDYFMDGKGNLLAEERFDSRKNSYKIVAYHKDDETEIFSQEVNLPEMAVVGVTPDKKSLVISNHDDELRRGALRAMSLVDGKLSAPLFSRKDADVEQAITDINRTIYGVMYSGLRPSYEFFDADVQSRIQAIVDAYPKHSVWLVDWSKNWDHLLVKVEGQSTSGDFILYKNGEKPQFLASARPNIKPEHVNPVVEFAYTARDGLRIPALVTVPASRLETLQKLPTVVLPHGGPSAHDWLGFDWLAQALASRGYLVIQPQFRGSSGFGLDHWLAGHGEWGKKMQDDLSDGLNALVKQKLADPERVCIIGGSYGGYAALAGGAFTPDLYKCVVSINGVSDLGRMLADERSVHGKDHQVVRYWRKLMAKGSTDREALEKISPSNFAERFKAPVLLLHGKDDEVVDFVQARIMAKNLKRKGKLVTLITLDDEDHFLSKSETRIQTLKEVVAFLDRHLEPEK